MWHNANLSLNVALVRNDPLATSTAGWRLIIFSCCMAACVTPRETSHSPKGSLVCILIFVIFLVCFGTYLFVRALFAETPKLGRHRKAIRNLWSRFELDPSTVAHVAGSHFFLFPLGVDNTISRVSMYKAYFVRTYR